MHSHWDRYNKPDDTASCWMRVAQPQTSGSMVLPRVGWEVIVEFLEGNPDRPIVTGRVYNGMFMPPYALPEGRSRTAIKSASSPGGKGVNEIRMEDKAGSEEVKVQSQKNTTIATANNKKKSIGSNETKHVEVDAVLDVGADQTTKITKGYLNTVGGAQTVTVGADRKVEVNAVYGLTSKGPSKTDVAGGQKEMVGNPIQGLLALAVKAATEAAQAEAQKALNALDKAVAAKVDQAMGPINKLQSQAQAIGKSMDALGNGNLGAAAGALHAAAGMPTPGGFGKALAGGGRGEAGDGAGGGGEGFSSMVGLDALVHGAIKSGGAALGAAVGAGGAGGGGASGANLAGPDGAVSGNAASDSTTGPGWAITECASTQAEKVGSVKATLALGGINTTIKGARKHHVGAARVELVAGTRAETCLATKKESALGLAVISKAPEQETVSGSRTTLVGGAVLEKIGGSSSVSATGKGLFVGAFHKVDAKSAIVLRCGGSEVVIDGGGVAIKADVVTISASKVTLTKTVSEA